MTIETYSNPKKTVQDTIEQGIIEQNFIISIGKETHEVKFGLEYQFSYDEKSGEVSNTFINGKNLGGYREHFTDNAFSVIQGVFGCLSITNFSRLIDKKVKAFLDAEIDQFLRAFDDWIKSEAEKIHLKIYDDAFSYQREKES